MKLLIYIGIGGFLGSVGRFALAQQMLKSFPSVFPVGTLAVNILGSLLLGFLFYISSKMDRDFFHLLTVGFCGGFTTFSTFSLDNLKHLINGEYLTAFTYIILSVVLGVFAAVLGYSIAKAIY